MGNSREDPDGPNSSIFVFFQYGEIPYDEISIVQYYLFRSFAIQNYWVTWRTTEHYKIEEDNFLDLLK